MSVFRRRQAPVLDSPTLILRRDITIGALYARAGSLEKVVSFIESSTSQQVPHTDAELEALLADFDAWRAER